MRPTRCEGPMLTSRTHCSAEEEEEAIVSTEAPSTVQCGLSGDGGRTTEHALAPDRNLSAAGSLLPSNRFVSCRTADPSEANSASTVPEKRGAERGDVEGALERCYKRKREGDSDEGACLSCAIRYRGALTDPRWNGTQFPTNKRVEGVGRSGKKEEGGGYGRMGYRDLLA